MEEKPDTSLPPPQEKKQQQQQKNNNNNKQLKTHIVTGLQFTISP